MNKIYAFLLLLTGTIITARASEAGAVGQPENLIEALDLLYENSDVKGVIKNEQLNDRVANTLISKVMIKSFSIPAKSGYLKKAIQAFTDDDKYAYQNVYFDKESDELYGVETESGIYTLHNPGEQTWMMSVKNAENPTLRDIYALVISRWEEPNGDVANGMICEITSKRPDFYKTTIVGPTNGGRKLRETPDLADVFTLDCVIENEAAGTRYDYMISDLNIDIDKNGNFVQSIPATDKRVMLSIDMRTVDIAKGRLCAYSNKGKLIGYKDFYIIPGFTLKVKFDTPNFTILNLSQYEEASGKALAARHNAMQPQVHTPSSAYSGNRSSSGYSNKAEYEKSLEKQEKTENYERAIKAYQGLIRNLNNQLQEIRAAGLGYQLNQEAYSKLSKQLQEAYQKMQNLVDKYAEEVMN